MNTILIKPIDFYLSLSFSPSSLLLPLSPSLSSLLPFVTLFPPSSLFPSFSPYLCLSLFLPISPSFCLSLSLSPPFLPVLLGCCCRGDHHDPGLCDPPEGSISPGGLREVEKHGRPQSVLRLLPPCGRHLVGRVGTLTHTHTLDTDVHLINIWSCLHCL